MRLLMVDGDLTANERESLRELRLHLRDRLPEARVAGLLPRLAAGNAEAVARELLDWAVGLRPVSLQDALADAIPRLFSLGSLPADRRWAFLREVANALLARLPVAEQNVLSHLIAPLLLAEPAAPEPRRNGASDSGPPAASLRRLTLILDRLDASPESGRGRRPTARLVAEAVLTATLAAATPAELERSLRDLRQRGFARGTAELFRILVQALPPWPHPDLTARTAPAVAAIERLVSLAPGAEQVGQRFHELVEAGVETFNKGALDRAELVFGILQRLLDRRVIDPQAVEPLRASGHERLDLDRLGRLLEGEDRREIPRSLLRFYRVFDPTALLDKLHRETARPRRGLLLAFLEAHGTDGRHAAFERLSRRPEQLQDVFLLRNLVHLLRRIPATESPWMPEQELGRVVRLLVPENPPFLVREVLGYLSEKRHPVAEQVLVRFVKTLEDALLSQTEAEGEAERDHLQAYLDSTCAALARHGTPAAWQAVIEHGLRSEPELGRTGRRLAGLGTENLSAQPALLARLVDVARSELPRGFLARPSPEQNERLRCLVAALSDTRTAEVQELLEVLAERFPDEDFGRRAGRMLAAAASETSRGFDPSQGATLSGDLRAFGLPTLLQNLAASCVTGALRLLDGRGQRAATLEFERGRLAGARYERLEGPQAVYQLLERPVRGTFAFVPRKPGTEPETASAQEITALLLEGLRRHDELRRAAVIVPDDARLEATGLTPRAVAGEDDIDLIISLWEKAGAGTTPQECERVLAADAYRIRRCLAQWVEEGALRLRPDASAPA